jgi:hypothetical protein
MARIKTSTTLKHLETLFPKTRQPSENHATEHQQLFLLGFFIKEQTTHRLYGPPQSQCLSFDPSQLKLAKTLLLRPMERKNHGETSKPLLHL